MLLKITMKAIMLSLILTLKKTVKTTLLSSMVVLMAAMPSSAETLDTSAQLEDKLYRQALYFYFTGNYGAALNQISINRQRFQSSSSRSQLFEAGLQVNVGLHSLATQSLVQLQQQAITGASVDEIADARQSSTSPEELMLIALLQLAEQQIQQGENKTAKQTLSKITAVSYAYRDQYKVLNQLAYWPQQPPQSVTNLTATLGEGDAANDNDNDQERGLNSILISDAYIKLNQALLHSKREEFAQAEPLLTKIKNTEWLTPSQTFWQLLFSPFSEDSYRENSDDNGEKTNDDQLQQQAINDYAKLLLAQMYVKQGAYEAAYYELKDFPQHSPYSESALFIFAFAAEKVEQYTTSRKLFNLVTAQYPYSHLGWQAALLLAKQVVEHMSLEEGMTSYQNAERLYQQRLEDLSQFQQAFSASNDLLAFAPNNSVVNSNTNLGMESLPFFTKQSYSTRSVWLQKALLNNELQGHYHALMELALITRHLQGQQQKSQWLKDTLTLNSQRKAKVIAQQQQSQYRSVIASLNAKQQNIEQLVEQAEREQQGTAFANKTQQQWLARIAKSQQAIAAIEDSKNTVDYQQRLKRVNGVLQWQLQQDFPARLWQHKKQLTEIKQLLVNAEQQSNRFETLANSQPLLSKLQARINTNATDTITLLSDVAALKQATSAKIQTLVQRFISHQEAVLKQHLLTARHEMAAVLESMAKFDKRIERQLSPHKNVGALPKEPATKASVMAPQAILFKHFNVEHDAEHKDVL